jgi:hypothetical protein
MVPHFLKTVSEIEGGTEYFAIGGTAERGKMDVQGRSIQHQHSSSGTIVRTSNDRPVLWGGWSCVSSLAFMRLSECIYKTVIWLCI